MAGEGYPAGGAGPGVGVLVPAIVAGVVPPILAGVPPSINDCVVADSVNGLAGGTGTQNDPVLTIAQAQAICTATKRNNILLRGDHTAATSLAGYVIVMQNHIDILDLNGQAVDGTIFYRGSITGLGTTLVNRAMFRDSLLVSLQIGSIEADNCGIVNTISISSLYALNNCYAYTNTQVTFNVGGVLIGHCKGFKGAVDFDSMDGGTQIFGGGNGYITVNNMSAGTLAIYGSVDLEVIIDATCTGGAGSITVTGVNSITDGSAPGTVVLSTIRGVDNRDLSEIYDYLVNPIESDLTEIQSNQAILRNNAWDTAKDESVYNLQDSYTPDIKSIRIGAGQTQKWCVFKRIVGGVSAIMLSKFNVEWDAPINVGSITGATITTPFLFQAENDAIYIFYGTATNIRFIKSTNYGSTWDAATTIIDIADLPATGISLASVCALQDQANGGLAPNAHSIHVYPAYAFSEGPFARTDFTATGVAGGGLDVGPGNPCLYILFSSPTVDYYAWFRVTGGVGPGNDPAVAGRTGIQVNLTSGDGAGAVCTATFGAIDAYGGGLIFNSAAAVSPNFYIQNLVAGARLSPSTIGTSSFTLVSETDVTYSGVAVADVWDNGSGGGTWVVNPNIDNTPTFRAVGMLFEQDDAVGATNTINRAHAIPLVVGQYIQYLMAISWYDDDTNLVHISYLRSQFANIRKWGANDAGGWDDYNVIVGPTSAFVDYLEASLYQDFDGAHDVYTIFSSNEAGTYDVVALKNLIPVNASDNIVWQDREIQLFASEPWADGWPSAVQDEFGNRILVVKTTYPVGSPSIYCIAFTSSGYERVIIIEMLEGMCAKAETTIDLNQAAGDYDLFTGSTEDVELVSLIFRCPDDAAGGALTSISIQTDNTTPRILITDVQGAVANLTEEAELAWTGAMLIQPGEKIQLTINGGAEGATYTCKVKARFISRATGGILI